MARTRSPLLTRFLFLLAWFQVIGPAVSSVADAWRLDQRGVYVHAESETGPGCVLAHSHDCLLCSVATAPNGTAPEPRHAPIADANAIAPTRVPITRRESACGGTASQRAPPKMSI